MKPSILFTCIVLFSTLFITCEAVSNQSEKEIPHYLRRDNFTVLRMIILNDQNQMLMVNDQGFWGMPWINMTKRQYLKESIDSLASAYGIELSDIELHGQFCFKYDYKPTVTFRNYYTARHRSGNIKTPKNTIESGFQDVEWVNIPEAIERNGNTGIKEITRQIIHYPDTIWGGSFMVSHTEDDHPTKMVEEFYPIFSR